MNEKEKQVIERLKLEGKSFTESLGAIASMRKGETNYNDYIKPIKNTDMLGEGFFTDMWGDIKDTGTALQGTWKDRFADVSETYDQFKENPSIGTGLLAVGDTALEAGKGAFQSLWDVAGGAVKAVAPQELEDFTEDTFTNAVKSITDNYTISPEFKQAGKNVNDWYTELKKTNPQMAKIIEMGGDAGELALEAFGWGAGGKVVKKTGGEVVSQASKNPIKKGYQWFEDLALKDIDNAENKVKNFGKSDIGGDIEDKVKDFFADSTAEKKAYEILQLPTSQTAKYVAKEKTPPAIREFIDNLDELVGSEDYKEVMKRLNAVNIKNMTTVDDIILKNNYSIDNKVLNSLKEEIGKVADNPSIKTSAKKAYQEVLDNYEEFFARKGTITRLEAQELKKQLNDSVRTLYDKAEAGTLTVQEKSEQKALDLVRRDIQRAVEGDDAIIRELNAKYTGIKDAVSAISKRDTKAMNTPELTKFQKLAAPAVEFISSMAGSGSATFVGRRALKTEKGLKKLLKELQEAKKKETKAHGKVDTNKEPKQSKDSKESKVSKKTVSKSSFNTTKIKDKSQYTKSDKVIVKEHNSIVKELKSKEKELKTLLSKKQTKSVKKAITQIKKVIKTLKTKLKNVRIKMEKAGLIARKGESEKGFVNFGADLKGSKDLISEAKKYKTADEFIEAQDKVYHGTNYNGARAIQEKGLDPQFSSSRPTSKGKKGIYYTANEEYAKSYATQKGGNGEGQNFVLRITKPKGIEIEQGTYRGQKTPDLIAPEKITPENIEIKGKDGVWYALKDFNLFFGEKDSLLGKTLVKSRTKSQLRKIWEEAHNK